MQLETFEPKETNINRGLIPPEYRDIDYSMLKDLGCYFGVIHLRQIAELKVITFEALQYSIYVLEYAIENKWTPPGLPKRTYLEAFMDAIYSFGVFEISEYVEQLNNFLDKENQVHEQIEKKKCGSDVIKQQPHFDAEFHKSYVQREMDDFSLLQRDILQFFYKITDQKTRLTAKLTSDDIAKALNRTPTAFKSTVARLIKNGLLERAEWKNGVQGWTRYRLSESVANILASETR